MRFVSIIVLLVLSLNLFAYAQPSADETIVYYVSPEGSDSNIGSIDAPFATIARAKKAVRENSLRGKRPIEVVLREGIYSVEEEIVFDKYDSGSAQYPVVYRAFEGETVSINGGYYISGSDLSLVGDEKVRKRFNPNAVSNIYYIDLKELGMKQVDKIVTSGFATTSTQSDNVLYHNGNMLHLARFPNDGFVSIKNIIDPGSGRDDPVKRPGKFVYDDERVENWENFKDVWMYGYWYVEWAPSTTNIAELDKENNTILTGHHSRYGFRMGAPYYYYNVLEELDTYGEYYIDRKNLLLYVYLEKPDDLYLTVLKTNILRFKNASHITLQGITIEGTRDTGVVIDLGDSIVFDGCILRYIGHKAMVMTGFNHIFRNGTIYEVGAGGIDVQTGERLFLRPGNAIIENNHIYNFSQVQRTYTPAVYMSGVANIVRHNLIHGSDHMAIELGGNDNILEYNEIYDVATNTDDAGAVYYYIDGSSRGGIVRYNFFHSIARRIGHTSTGTWAIYWDGWISDRQVYGNIFYDMPNGIHINGGQYNTVTENIFADVDRPIWAHGIDRNSAVDFWKHVDDIPYDRGIWRQKYPKILEKRDNDQYKMYQENTIGNNLFYKCGASSITPGRTDLIKNYYYENIYSDDENLFEGIEKLNFNFKKTPPKGFEQIEFDKIGLKRRRN